MVNCLSKSKVYSPFSSCSLSFSLLRTYLYKYTYTRIVSHTLHVISFLYLPLQTSLQPIIILASTQCKPNCPLSSISPLDTSLNHRTKFQSTPNRVEAPYNYLVNPYLPPPTPPPDITARLPTPHPLFKTHTHPHTHRHTHTLSLTVQPELSSLKFESHRQKHRSTIEPNLRGPTQLSRSLLPTSS